MGKWIYVCIVRLKYPHIFLHTYLRTYIYRREEHKSIRNCDYYFMRIHSILLKEFISRAGREGGVCLIEAV